jgi:pimeloyl-ACP methyl ester carboxylesterase
MSSTSTPEGSGSVSGAPNLPEGFADTFTSRYVDAGEVRLHAVVGGDGPPLLLIHGWPGSWYYWRLVMPTLARDFTVVAVDQRGIGLSDKPEKGYDAGTLANDLIWLMDALGHHRFAVVGVDTGMLIGYALAADHADRVDRVALGEAPLPGISPPIPLILPPAAVDRLWHIPFNHSARRTRSSFADGRKLLRRGVLGVCRHAQVARGDGAILRGRPRLERRGAPRQLPDVPRVRRDRGARRGAEEASAHYAGARARRRRQLGDMVRATLELAADDVTSVVFPECGHWLAEQVPDAMVTTLSEFLAPCREG